MGLIDQEEADRLLNNFFLQEIRKLCSNKNIVLIFDECTSGFRQNFGGLHKLYNVYPDMSMFGKALGNGYAITAILGKREIMENAKNSFISSTFWTERLGYVAGLSTLELMKKTKSWKTISSIGNKIKEKWQQLSNFNNIKIEITGLPALPAFSFSSDKNNILMTFFCQEMLKKGFLASNVVFVSVVHDEKILNEYFDNCDEIFFKIGSSSINKIKSELLSDVRLSSFSRLN